MYHLRHIFDGAKPSKCTVETIFNAFDAFFSPFGILHRQNICGSDSVVRQEHLVRGMLALVNVGIPKIVEKSRKL
jgi:hypothetical protein